VTHAPGTARGLPPSEGASHASPPSVPGASVMGAPSRVLTDPHLDTIPPMKAVLGGARPGIVGSFQVAIAGVLRTVATQRNMKIHVVAGLMVAIVGMALPLDLSVRVALLFAVSIVFFAEILNTALEAVIDLFVQDFSRLAMLAKDAAAGGVLVFAVTTVLVLADILWTEWHLVIDHQDAVARSCLFGIPLVLNEAMGLFLVRRRRLHAVRVVVSASLLWPLVAATRDPIFAVVAVLLVGVALAARTLYLPRADHGQP
jgi:diacylglycerol kinase (ATP)